MENIEDYIELLDNKISILDESIDLMDVVCDKLLILADYDILHTTMVNDLKGVIDFARYTRGTLIAEKTLYKRYLKEVD